MTYEYPSVGVMFISDTLPKQQITAIESEIKRIEIAAREQLERYLDSNGLTLEMGVIHKPKHR